MACGIVQVPARSGRDGPSGPHGNNCSPGVLMIPQTVAEFTSHVEQLSRGVINSSRDAHAGLLAGAGVPNDEHGQRRVRAVAYTLADLEVSRTRITGLQEMIREFRYFEDECTIDGIPFRALRAGMAAIIHNTSERNPDPDYAYDDPAGCGSRGRVRLLDIVDLEGNGPLKWYDGEDGPRLTRLHIPEKGDQFYTLEYDGYLTDMAISELNREGFTVSEGPFTSHTIRFPREAPGPCKVPARWPNVPDMLDVELNRPVEALDACIAEFRKALDGPADPCSDRSMLDLCRHVAGCNAKVEDGLRDILYHLGAYACNEASYKPSDTIQMDMPRLLGFSIEQVGDEQAESPFAVHRFTKSGMVEGEDVMFCEVTIPRCINPEDVGLLAYLGIEVTNLEQAESSDATRVYCRMYKDLDAATGIPYGYWGADVRYLRERGLDSDTEWLEGAIRGGFERVGDDVLAAARSRPEIAA